MDLGDLEVLNLGYLDDIVIVLVFSVIHLGLDIVVKDKLDACKEFVVAISLCFDLSEA